MVLRQDIKTIEDIYFNDLLKLLDTYNEKYTNKSKNQYDNFLNNIETNKKYYKLGINKKI